MIRRILFLSLLLVLSFIALTARADTGAVVSGNVCDGDGQPIGGASVSLTSRSGDFGFLAATDAEGRFTVRAVTPGEYRLRALHADYADVVFALNIAAGEKPQMQLVLPAATGQRERTVQAAAPDPFGDSYEQTARLAAGSINAGDGSWNELHSYARPEMQNRLKIDGLDATPVFRVNGFRPRLAASTETVAETIVEASAAGARVQLESRRGGDTWHGSASGSARGAAAGPHTQRSAATAAGVLKQNRLFVFGSAERLAQQTQMRQMEMQPRGTPVEQSWLVPAGESGYTGRLDLHASTSHSLYARYAWRSARQSARDESIAGAESAATAAWIWAGASATSELRVRVARTPISVWPAATSIHRIAEAGSTMIRLPGGDSRGAFDYRPRSSSVREDVSWREWKAGAELRLLRVPIHHGARTISTFGSAEEYLANRAFKVIRYSEISGTTGAQEQFSAYAQREWRMRPSLLMAARLRYELHTVNRELHGRARVFDAARLDYVEGRFYTPEKLAFAPGAAFAWSPGTGTVIRAGGGVHYGAGSYRNLMQPVENAAPPVQVTGGQGLELPYGNDVRNYRVPERHFQYGVSVERELRAGLTAEAGYLGAHGRHLLLESVANLITAVDPLTGAITRQNARYGEVPLTTSGGDDLYHALHARLTRRFEGGLTMTAAWTWAQSRGHSADAVQDPRCLMCERSPGNYDVRHSLAGNAAYTRRGWTIGGMFTARTGLPLNVLIDRPDAVLDANGRWMMSTPGGGANRTAQRPDLVSGVDPYAREGRQWLNPDAFAIPAAGTYGSLARNGLRGPGLAQIDVAVMRTVRLTERAALELRGAIYNASGRSNYRNPANVLPHAGFGFLAVPIVQAGSTHAGRDAELTARFVF